ncbi:tigger transposable element-derived protein 2-like [Bombus pascuorum]|uniref:tigger transposable element-derived protein 2-like n=1 Tax=Bombus pascuorum TaxID=65598 RepID=UPI00298E2FAD|nr:tigger transposable element-derived protein 2-like [Bombus pascuorum]
MTPKRKQLPLTPEKKNEILEIIDIVDLNTGNLYSVIAEAYGISISTVASIKARAAEIKQSLQKNSPAPTSSKKHLKMTHNTDLKRVLYQWYKRCKDNNVEITGLQLRKKALELNEKLNGNSAFKASHGWMSNFKARNHITVEETRGDFPTPNKAAVDNFKTAFTTFLQNEGCTLENVYNAHYTPIVWKAVPEEILIFQRVKLESDQEECEDHINTLFCANASGCHKLPVLIISSIAETQRFYNFNTDAFSTTYRSNSNTWIDSTIFNQWFEKHFLKLVKEKQLKNGHREKTLLLLGNVRSHHDLEELNKEDEFVTVKSFPCDVRPLIEPMDHGIIACFKRKYRKELVETFMPLTIYNTENKVIHLHEELNIWDFCRIVHAAWSYVDDAIMINTWKFLLKDEIKRSVENLEIIKKDVDETVALLQTLPRCKGCNRIDVINWFQIDDRNDILRTICTDEVLHDFRNNTLDEVNIDIVDDEARPSH